MILFAMCVLIESFVMRFNEFAIHRTLRICGNLPEIKLRAERTFDPASVTIPTIFGYQFFQELTIVEQGIRQYGFHLKNH